MQNKFDLFDNIQLNEKEKEFFNVNKQFSNVIVEIIKKRLELNMTQRELAEKTGIKQPMIARIEKFDSVPRLDTLIKILDALDLNICFENIYKLQKKSYCNIKYDYKKIDYCFNDDKLTHISESIKMIG